MFFVLVFCLFIGFCLGLLFGFVLLLFVFLCGSFFGEFVCVFIYLLFVVVFQSV